MIQKCHHESRLCVLLTVRVPVPQPAVSTQCGLAHRFLEARMSFEYTDTLIPVGYAIQQEAGAPVSPDNSDAATIRAHLL